MALRTSRVPPDQWVQPISEFTATRQNLPHLQDPGSWYWTESTTHNRHLLTEAERDIVFSSILFHDGGKYDLCAAVVLPDHFHLILHPLEKEPDAFYSLPEIFHSIKSFSAQKISKLRREDIASNIARVGSGIPAASTIVTSSKKGGKDVGGRDATLYARDATRYAKAIEVFQDENYDHIIRNEKEYLEKLNYLILNPVRAGLVERAEDYRWLYYV